MSSYSRRNYGAVSLSNNGAGITFTSNGLLPNAEVLLTVGIRDGTSVTSKPGILETPGRSPTAGGSCRLPSGGWFLWGGCHAAGLGAH